MRPSTFLTGLWGREIDPRLRIQIWSLADRRTFPIQAPDAADYYANGKTDVYTCVALCDKNFKGGAKGSRPSAADSRAIAGLWLDIDVDGGPQNKTGCAPDQDAAWRLANAILTPTVAVWSGYGLHAWYLLPELWMFYRQEDQDAAALASAQFYEMHARRAFALGGWNLDTSTRDLARLMRLPGTINGKGGQSRAVEVDDHRGPRHDRDDLLALCSTIGPIDLTTPGAAVGDVSDITLSARGARRALTDDQLQALLADPDFRAVFEHAPGTSIGWEDSSLSNYDMSIATTLARAGGWSNQQIADVIAAHRAHHGEHGKARRIDYLRRTIARARANAQRTDAQATLDELAGRKAA